MADSTFSERAEKFYSELTYEHFQVDAGLKEDLDLVPIYERYADLFAESAVRERIAAVLASRASPNEKAENQAQLSAARGNAVKESRHLADFAATGYIDNSIKELTEAITNAELKATVEWDEQQIPYQNVYAVLVRERDYARRHDLQSRQIATMAKQNGLRRERIQAQHDLALRLGFASYRKMIETLRGWDLPVLSKALNLLVTETDTLFENKLDRHLAQVHVPRAEANTSDVAYLVRAPQYDNFFPAARLLPAFEKTMAGLGLEIESTPGLHLDTVPRPLKSPRAFCAPVRVPSDVYLVIKPIGGQEDYRALFHESGHAEHFSHVEASLPFAFRYLGDDAVSETFAFLFEQLVFFPRWLVDVLHIPLREAEEYWRFALFNKLWLVRRYAAKLRYELVLHDEGPSGMDTAYRDFLGQVLHVIIAPERYLEDVDDAFYVAGYLRAWIFERQLANFLLEQFGEGWYESREAGSFLRSLWSIGMRDPADELARTRIGARGLDPLPLIEELADF